MYLVLYSVHWCTVHYTDWISKTKLEPSVAQKLISGMCTRPELVLCLSIAGLSCLSSRDWLSSRDLVRGSWNCWVGHCNCYEWLSSKWSVLTSCEMASVHEQWNNKCSHAVKLKVLFNRNSGGDLLAPPKLWPITSCVTLRFAWLRCVQNCWLRFVDLDLVGGNFRLMENAIGEQCEWKFTVHLRIVRT